MANHYGFDGRVALVTGGASGIGAATAARLREGGAEVHVFDLRAGEGTSVTGDISSSRRRRRRGRAGRRGPASTCSSAAAGVGGDSLHTEEVTDEEWQRVHAINPNGVFFANRAAIPKMNEGGYGRIVNVASIAGKEGNPMAGAYSSSKAAVIGLTKAIGKDVAGTRHPRQLHRAGGDQHADPRARSPQEHIDYMIARIPLGRMGEAEEVAALICWLASEEMTFSTGACFDISGGRARVLMRQRPRARPAGASSRMVEGGTVVTAARRADRAGRARDAALRILRLLPPIEAPEIWCAGVTYERSRDARLEEARRAGRLRARLRRRPARALPQGRRMRRTVGPGGRSASAPTRAGSCRSPSSASCSASGGAIAGCTIGNDVSSRDIEGANPLYIPQAKIFAGACAIGPPCSCPDDWDAPFAIRLRITDAGRRRALRRRDVDRAG